MTLAVDLMIRKLCYLIVIIENQHPGLKSQGFLPVHHGIGDNDHLITFLHQPGCGTIDTDHATAPFAHNRIGFKALAVIYIHHLNLFTGKNIRLNLQETTWLP